MIELQNVSKSFSGQVVLHPTTLTIEAGKVTVLLGPSGCGKSTILRIMIGLLEPDEGSVKIYDTLLSPTSVESLRQQIGYVIQDGGLFPHLTAYDNISILARNLGWPKEKIDNRVQYLSQLTHLDSQFLDRFPSQLSGGQRQRVGIMRALMLDPQVILLDEPMGALDPLVRHDMQADLRDIFRSLEKTVVLVTHDLGEAAFLGDTIALLGEGKIVQLGTYADLVNQPASPYVTRFLQAQRLPDFSTGASE